MRQERGIPRRFRGVGCGVRINLAFVCLLCAWGALAEETTNEVSQLSLDPAVKVFLDGDGANHDFLRSNISFANFVRDRADSDVHVIITSAVTGSGSIEHTLSFGGKRKFADLNYRLTWVSPGNASEDEKRKGMLNCLLKGLMPFVARTTLADSVRISAAPAGKPVKQPVDPWDSWVFSVSLSEYASGEESSFSSDFYATLRASRVTEANKVDMEASLSESRAKYESGESTIATRTHGRGLTGRYIGSLGDHFSAGAIAQWSDSSSLNMRSATHLGPAVEYNLFPYSEYAQREFDLYYQVTGIYADYYERTVYGKTSEFLVQQQFTVRPVLKREWGSLSASASYRSYMGKPSLYSVSFDGYVSLSLGRGFSVDLNGGYSVIHDQVYLSAEGSTTEEILLRIRRQETEYSYWVSTGITYTFGSIYNNVVNPRF